MNGCGGRARSTAIRNFVLVDFAICLCENPRQRGEFEADHSGTGGRAGADRRIYGLAQPPHPKLADGAGFVDWNFAEHAERRMDWTEDVPAGRWVRTARAAAVCF